MPGCVCCGCRPSTRLACYCCYIPPWRARALPGPCAGAGAAHGGRRSHALGDPGRHQRALGRAEWLTTEIVCRENPGTEDDDRRLPAAPRDSRGCYTVTLSLAGEPCGSCPAILAAWSLAGAPSPTARPTGPQTTPHPLPRPQATCSGSGRTGMPLSRRTGSGCVTWSTETPFFTSGAPCSG